MTATPAFLTTGIPGWLQPHKLDTGPPYTEYTLEQVLARLATGKTLAQVCQEDPTMPEYGQLLRYIHSNPALLDQYYQAQLIGSEANVDRFDEKMRSKGVGEDGIPEDAAWLAQEMKWVMWIAGKRNERYRDKREIDITTTVDISEAMEKASRRLSEGRLIEGERVG